MFLSMPRLRVVTLRYIHFHVLPYKSKQGEHTLKNIIRPLNKILSEDNNMQLQCALYLKNMFFTNSSLYRTKSLGPFIFDYENSHTKQPWFNEDRF